jgi:hypothetical protein
MKDLTFLFGIVILSLMAITIDFFNSRRNYFYKKHMSNSDRLPLQYKYPSPPPPINKIGNPVVSPMKCIGRIPYLNVNISDCMFTIGDTYQVRHSFDECGELVYRVKTNKGSELLLYDIDNIFEYAN